MKNIYFVRHAQSDANAGGAYQGTDTPLSEEGKEQAEKVAERFARISLDAIVTSTFPRAIETGVAIAKKTHATVAPASDLFGERQHPPEALGLLTDSKEYKHIRKETWRLFERGERYSSEENFDDLCKRADKALALVEGMKEENIVVVSHGNFLRFLVARLCWGETLTPQAFVRFMNFAAVSNTGITHLELKDGAWRMRQWNDSAHLG